MIDPIIIKETKLVPNVILDKDKNIFKITGKSITFNTIEFYEKIISWFKLYLKNPNKYTKLILYFEYINSSSSIQLNRLLKSLESNKKENIIKIIWLYDEDDELLFEMGKELQSSTQLKFELRKNIIKK